MRTFAISEACLSTVGIVLVFLARHLSGRVVGFFQALNGGFVRFDVVLVFFVVRLVAGLSEDFRVDGRDFPREFDGDLLRLGCEFV